MVSLTVPTGFQHQYEKTCPDNEELNSLHWKFLEKRSSGLLQMVYIDLCPDNYINASHWEIFLHNPSIQFSHTCKHIQFVSHKCLSNPQITLTLLSNTKGLHGWNFCVGKKKYFSLVFAMHRAHLAQQILTIAPINQMDLLGRHSCSIWDEAKTCFYYVYIKQILTIAPINRMDVSWHHCSIWDDAKNV